MAYHTLTEISILDYEASISQRLKTALCSATSVVVLKLHAEPGLTPLQVSELLPGCENLRFLECNLDLSSLKKTMESVSVFLAEIYPPDVA